MTKSRNIGLVGIGLFVVLFWGGWGGSGGVVEGAICPLGDLDGNCKVDLVDVQMLTGFWLDPGCTTPGCEADLTAGAGVNLSDYTVMAANYNKTGVHVVISEFMADNEGSFLTKLNGEWIDPDWIELYNPSDVTVDLGGCYLVDSRNQWPFPPGTILPGNSYLIVFASKQDGDDVVDDLGYLHTNFGLDNDGEYLALVLPNGETVEHAYPDEYPQYDDWSYGLSPDLQSEGYFFPATPGKPNTTSEPISDPTKNVVISEIMYHPYHDNENTQPEPTSREFIEIYNRGIMTVNLADWRFSDGVNFTFPAMVLDPNQYLVVAADVSVFLSAYPQVNPNQVVGGWTGRLSNSGEDVDLDDENGLRMDSVHYFDQGDWSSRELGPSDEGHRGWQWNDDHDGGGKSLELIHPRISNNFGQNWAASLVAGGTPGQPNTVAKTNLAPMILDVKHKPLIPKSDEPVLVTARIRDEAIANCIVKLHYREDESTYDKYTYPQYDPNAYSIIAMRDDGLNGDRDAGDGTYTGQIPAYAAGTIVEFFVEADDGIGSRTWPAPADVDGEWEQVVNCLYQVYRPDSLFDPADAWAAGSQPLYHIIMTYNEQRRLERIHEGDGSYSSAQMNATFISVDGVDTKCRYTTGTRNRGHGTRTTAPYNFRVNFRNDEPWKTVTAINLNCYYTYYQYLGHVLHMMAGLPSEDPLAVQLRINGVNHTLDTTDTFRRTQGSYVHLEVYDSEWAANHYPDDPDGNLYSAVSYTRTADLNFLSEDGWDPNDYNKPKDKYEKESNTALHDWWDLMYLTYILDVDETSEPDWLVQVEQVVNRDQWLRWFALNNLMTSSETTLSTGDGDDYFMYFGSDDPRCILIPHDLDSILDRASTTESIWLGHLGSSRINDLPEIKRFLQHPKYAGEYYKQFRDLFDTVFAQEKFDAEVDRLLNWAPSSTRTGYKNFIASRRSNVLTGASSQIPQNMFTIQTDIAENPSGSGLYKTASATLSGANLTGSADVYETRSVLVNGIEADWDPIDGDWDLDAALPLNPGINRVIVQTFDELEGQGNELKRDYLDIWYDDGDTLAIPNPLVESNTVLDAASGPWILTASLTIPAGYTLTIEAGTTVFCAQDARITVNGKLIIDGSEYQRVRMALDPDSADTEWGGLNFSNTTQDNVVAYVDLEDATSSSNVIDVSDAKLLLDNVTFPGVTDQTVLEITDIDLIVRNCVFPSLSSDETVHGHDILPAGRLVFEGNTFGTTSGYSDIIDFTNAHRPGPILEAYNNLFLGGGDDAFDLDGTDAHIEGNIFYAFANGNDGNTSSSTANAIATDANSEITLARNIFIGGDHHVLLKGGVFVIAQNNVFIGATLSAINFGEPGRGVPPGEGALLEGNIFYDNAAVFHNLFNNPSYPGEGPETDPVVQYCILPDLATDHIDLVTGNMIGVQSHFVDPDTEDYQLRYFSPALGTGPLGLDIGAYVPEGAALKLTTLANSATITVGGPGITDYQYSVDNPNGPWNPETPISQPIQLNGLVNEQSYTVYVIGKNSAGLWQDSAQAASVTWTVSNNGVPLVINELLAINDTGVEHNGQYPDMIELYYGGAAPVFLDNMTISDDPGDPMKYRIPNGTMLDSTNRYLVLYADPNTVPPYHTGFALDGDGEAIYLYDTTGHLLDSVEFGTQIPDLSIGRVNQGPWRLTVPTMGQENQVQDVGVPETLKINEWLANGKVLFADDFVELCNPDPQPVDLSSMFLSDNPITQPYKHSLRPLSYIAGDGYRAFDVDDSDQPGHLNFLLNATKEMISLLDPEKNVIDQVFYGPQTTDVSQGRSPDGGNLLAFYELPTPNIANSTSDTDPTTLELISGSAEVLYFVPSDSTDQASWMQTGYANLSQWQSDTTPLGFGNVYHAGKVAMTAYNDCVYESGAAQYIADHVTTYGIGSGYSGPTSGPLQDLATGEDTGITVSFTQNGGVNWNTGTSGGGTDTAADTDAYELFHNIADMLGVIYYGSDDGWWVDATFTGLNPHLRYRFATSANRNETTADYENRFTRYSLSGAEEGYSNISSDGVIVNAENSVSFCTGVNTANGYVAQWTDIAPGVDGSFSVKAEAHGAPYQTRKAYSFDVFMLQVLQTESPLEQVMVGNNASCYTRIEFDLDENPADISALTLRMRYDDAFVAYLNGQEVARNNFTGTPQWNSVADGDRDNVLAADWQTIDLGDSIEYLQSGTNVLAVQVLNESMQDPNLLYLPELEASIDPNTDTAHYEMAIKLLRGLRITELMYHPQDEPTSHPDAEFIELQNVGSEPLDLGGVRFTNGITFTCPAMTLDAEEYIVLVKDPVIFQNEYGVIPEVVGQYSGSLSNGGEEIILQLPAPFEAAIMRFDYNDTWYPTTDGGGYALVITDPLAPAATWGDRDYWSAGNVLGGSPGTGDP
jgi:CotH protein/lamin tail-like protein